MSLENDPFDDIPSQPPDETQPAEPPPSYPQFYTQQTDVTAPPAPKLPRWALVVLGLIIVLLIAVICLLFTALVTENTNRPTPLPTTVTPQPQVQAAPATVVGGMVITVRGQNFKPNEQVVFYLRDATRPTEPILQIGSTVLTPQSTFE